MKTLSCFRKTFAPVSTVIHDPLYSDSSDDFGLAQPHTAAVIILALLDIFAPECPDVNVNMRKLVESKEFSADFIQPVWYENNFVPRIDNPVLSGLLLREATLAYNKLGSSTEPTLLTILIAMIEQLWDEKKHENVNIVYALLTNHCEGGEFSKLILSLAQLHASSDKYPNMAIEFIDKLRCLNKPSDSIIIDVMRANLCVLLARLYHHTAIDEIHALKFAKEACIGVLNEVPPECTPKDVRMKFEGCHDPDSANIVQYFAQLHLVLDSMHNKSLNNEDVKEILLIFESLLNANDTNKRDIFFHVCKCLKRLKSRTEFTKWATIASKHDFLIKRNRWRKVYIKGTLECPEPAQVDVKSTVTWLQHIMFSCSPSPRTIQSEASAANLMGPQDRLHQLDGDAN